MDTTELGNAFRHLLTAAGAISDTALLAADSRSDIDWTLSHIAFSDRVLAAAARDVRTGLPTFVDNREAMDENAISSLIASTTQIRAIPAAAIPVSLRLVSRDGQPLPEQRLPWGTVFRLRATEHLPGHTERISLFASTE
ncbi:hypothetical protein [Streptomyces sp. NPDC059649]|uniref:hypothetical protein n=1 Tax=Streptomyces sp. NPDC059649 TaxID=3346895 RepID=UPI0036A43BDA